MVLAGAVLLTLALRNLAPLSVGPGFCTYPEIAALVGETPTEVKCDPEIAHRMAFVSAKSLSRAGLLDALGLTLVPDGARRRMKDANAAQEREWANDLRRSLERRYARILRAGIVAADAGTAKSPEDGWTAPYTKAMTDPGATVAERRRADERFLDEMGSVMAFGESGEAAVRALAAFPTEIPMELLERGTAVDTLPLNSLSPSALRTLKRVYPKLQGDPNSIVVRRRSFGRFGPLSMQATLGVVDPGVVVPADRGIVVMPYSMNSTTSTIDMIASAGEDGSLRLRGYGAAVAAARATEGEARELADRYAPDLPRDLGDYGSLSQVAEAWAKKGHDVILELDPVAEWVPSVFVGGKFHPKGIWSLRAVEGVLALQSHLRFAHGRRRYPYRALLAMEAAGAKPQMSDASGTRWPSPEARAEYVALAGPADRWDATSYRGWAPEALERGASWRRVVNFAPAETLTQADRLVRELNAGAPATSRSETGNVREWRIPLVDLPPAAQAAIAEELRSSRHGGGNVLAYSPAAMDLYLRRGVLIVTVGRFPNGFGRAVTIWSDVPAFNETEGGAQLSGE